MNVGTRRRWPATPTGRARMVCSTWRAMCGSGRAVCGTSSQPDNGYPYDATDGRESLSAPGHDAASCAAGRSGMALGICAAPTAAGTLRATGTTVTVFVWCPPAFEISGLWRPLGTLRARRRSLSEGGLGGAQSVPPRVAARLRETGKNRTTNLRDLANRWWDPVNPPDSLSYLSRTAVPLLIVTPPRPCVPPAPASPAAHQSPGGRTPASGAAASCAGRRSASPR